MPLKWTTILLPMRLQHDVPRPAASVEPCGVTGRAVASDRQSQLIERWLPLVWLACGLVTLSLYISTAAPTLSWRNGGDDGGDLAVAAASLGVAHPTGYPLYVLTGWLWLRLLPLGDVGYRLNVFSGVCTALAVGAGAWAATELIRDARPHARLTQASAASAAAALLLGVSAPAWGQAVVASVYSLNLAFAGVLMGMVLRGQRTGASVQGSALFGGLLGLGLGNHVTLGFVGVASAVVAIGQRWPWRMWLAAIAAMLLALTAIYSYLLLGNVETRDPIRAWGDPSTLPGFLRLVTAQSYQGLVGRVPPGQVAQRVLRTTQLLMQVLTPVGLVAAILGATQAAADHGALARRRLAAPLVLALAAFTFAITYGAARAEHHLLLMYLPLALLAGVGFTDALTALSRWISPGSLHHAAGLVGLLILVGVAGWLSRGVAARGDFQAVDFAMSQLRAQPTNGRLLTETDANTFALWYVQEILGVRPDVAVVQLGLWQTSSTYRSNLVAQHPWLGGQ